MQPSLSVGAFIRFGWETFKKRPWFFIGLYLIPVPVFIVFGIVLGIISEILTATVTNSGIKVIGDILVFVVDFSAQLLLLIGMYAAYLKAHDALDTARFRDLWHPKGFFRFLGALLLLLLITIVGFALFVIPGIIASLTFGMAPLLTIDKGLGPIAALKESARIMKGNRLRLFALGGGTLLVMLLGVLALIVGVVVAVPVAMLALVHGYRQFQLAADQNAPKQPLSGGEIAFLIIGLVLPMIIVVGLFSSIVLASLNSAREKGQEALTESNLQSLQLSLELYYDGHDFVYPAALSEAIQDPDVLNQNIVEALSPNDFVYTPTEDRQSYQLCAAPKTSGEEVQCVSSGDPTPTE